MWYRLVTQGKHTGCFVYSIVAQGVDTLRPISIVKWKSVRGCPWAAQTRTSYSTVGNWRPQIIHKITILIVNMHTIKGFKCLGKRVEYKMRTLSELIPFTVFPTILCQIWAVSKTHQLTYFCNGSSSIFSGQTSTFHTSYYGWRKEGNHHGFCWKSDLLIVVLYQTITFCMGYFFGFVNIPLQVKTLGLVYTYSP